MLIRTRDVRRVRRNVIQSILAGTRALVIVSDGRRYRLGGKVGNSVVCLGRKYEKLAHAEALAHTKFPGKSIERVNQPKAKGKKAA